MNKPVPNGIPWKAGVIATAFGLMLGTSAIAQVATGQAPMLDALVASGDLPPVAERVGSEPMVITPVDGVRNYGGNLRQTYAGAGDESWPDSMIGYQQNLVRWNSNADGVEPNLAESWEVNDDATEFVFHLREGARWSDGEPFTSKDIMFWFNHAQFNQELSVDVRVEFLSPDDGLAVEAIDDYTVKFTFAEPKALFLILMAQPYGGKVSGLPAHYMSQFHIDTNPNADAEAVAAGFQNWIERFNSVVETWENPDMPNMLPWVLTDQSDGTSFIRMERNPYFWQVDDQGNQLPYIDTVTFEIVENYEVMLLKALNGELDYIARYINTDENRPVLIENEDRANLEFFEMVMARASDTQIHVNQTVQDPVLRELFTNRDARIAMSIAIDREEIIDLVYQGQGRPHQVSPRPEEVAFYDEEMGTQFTEYDPDRANEILDSLGYDKRDSNGWRLSPDGKPVSFVITLRNDRQPYVDMTPFIAEDWRDIGLNVEWRAIEKSAKNAFRDSNQHHVLIDDGDGASMGAYIFPRAFVPLHPDAAWMTGWVQWVLSGGAQGEEPPEHIKEQIALNEQMQREPDLEKQANLYRQILANAKERFNQFGINLPVSRFAAHSRNLKNVPDVAHAGTYALAFPGPTLPQQFSFMP